MNPALLFPYGCCPVCGLPGVRRDRRPGGNDRCEGGHTYPSAEAKQPKKRGEHRREEKS